jgi:hypothetical protein
VINPFLPVPLEQEGRLNDMPLCKNSIERVFAYYRWTEMLEEYRTGSPRRTASPLVRFHTADKLSLMAHSPKHYTEMGLLVADAGKRDWDELTAEYGPCSWRASPCWAREVGMGRGQDSPGEPSPRHRGTVSPLGACHKTRIRV